ncbi:MAG: imidazoleglycerol phosphate synthase, cyclase subunit, partial [Cyanobacteria bacterium RYN_339]|nr:imidazoleglycerol phosphate synthase, cyclase subunit [Cyanobacteria bacterium RYN_339]
MQKIRVMPTLLFKDFTLVKGVGYNSWRRVGSAMQAVKVYNMREVDELVFLDIGANQEGRSPDLATVDEIADECFMPLTVGGGVRTVEDVRQLLAVGADKVAINTQAVETPELVRDVANQFGAQCVVASVDVRRLPNGRYEVYTCSGTRATGKDPVDFDRELAALGAGEILLSSIERDGTMAGYDLELIRQVGGAVTIPVIASGGAGTYQHLAEA